MESRDGLDNHFLSFTSWLEIGHSSPNHSKMKFAYPLIFLCCISCERSNTSPTEGNTVPPPSSPAEEYPDFLASFLKDWGESNELFFMKPEEVDFNLAESNGSAEELISSFNFPMNWTEIQYREETEFSQEYDVTIKVRSQVEVRHLYKEGLWRFDSGRHYDFNATIVKSYSEYSTTIGKAWIGRLPKEMIFEEAEKLFRKVPPPRYE